MQQPLLTPGVGDGPTPPCRQQLHRHLPDYLVVREQGETVVEGCGNVRPRPLAADLPPGLHEGQDRIDGQVLRPARTDKGRSAWAGRAEGLGQSGRPNPFSSSPLSNILSGGSLGGNFTQKQWALDTKLYRPDPLAEE